MTFEIDADGLVKVAASDVTTGRIQQVQVSPSSGLTSDEVNKLIKRTQDRNEEEDTNEQA